MDNGTKIHFADEIVIYRSIEDECCVAHSLRTDQIGAGDRIVDAISELVRGVNGLLKMAEQDSTIAYLREAPAGVKHLYDNADDLPLELFEVAYKMATGSWPAYLEVDVDIVPDDSGRALKTHIPNGVGIG